MKLLMPCAGSRIRRFNERFDIFHFAVSWTHQCPWKRLLFWKQCNSNTSHKKTPWSVFDENSNVFSIIRYLVLMCVLAWWREYLTNLHDRTLGLLSMKKLDTFALHLKGSCLANTMRRALQRFGSFCLMHTRDLSHQWELSLEMVSLTRK